MLPRITSSPLMALVALAVLMASGCGGAETRKARHLEKGQNFLAAESFEKARVEFQNALQIAPKDAQTRFEMGVVDEKLGNPREAAQFYQGAIDSDPDHLGARANLARLYLFSGAPDRALALIAPALETHPDDSELLTVRAAARLQQKDLSAAQTDAERAVALAPTNEDAVAVLAGLYSSIGATDRAQALLEQSIQKIPGTVDLRLALAQLYSQKNRTADIEALLLKLVQLKPLERAHRVRLAQFYAGSKQLDAAERTLRQAIVALPGDRSIKMSLIDFLTARRSRDAAEKELKGMIAAAPEDYELKFALARFYEAGKQSDRAEAAYQEVIKEAKLEPAGLVARDRLAESLAARDDLAGASALISLVLAKSPRDDDALFLRGNIELAKQDPRAAIADLRAVLRDQPNSVGLLRALARAHIANGEPAVAEEVMRHAVDANPKDATLLLEFAQVLVQLGKADQAKLLLAKLVQEQPDNASALEAQFRVAQSTKDYAAAKSAADGLVALRPKLSVGYLFQGMIAEAQNRSDEALRLYAAAADAQPEMAEGLQAQIQLLLGANRRDEALKRAHDFSLRYPKSALGPDAEGELLLASGNVAEAQAAFKEAIVRVPKWWIPYRGLAAARIAGKDPSEAITTLRGAKTIVAQPEAVGAELAALLQRLGKPDEAASEYEEVLRSNPRAEVAANNLAMLLVTYKTDRPSLERAKALSARFANSANPSLLDTYGWVLYKSGETAAAVPVLQRVVAQVPKEAVAHYHLGMAESQLGSRSEARDNLMRAVNSGTNFPGLDEAKATLDKLAVTPHTVIGTPNT
jgi:tetratricopeptide (TPR) repeat protein